MKLQNKHARAFFAVFIFKKKPRALGRQFFRIPNALEQFQNRFRANSKNADGDWPGQRPATRFVDAYEEFRFHLLIIAKEKSPTQVVRLPRNPKTP